MWGGLAIKATTSEKYFRSSDLIECFNLSTSQWNELRAKSNSPSDLPHPCANAKIAVVQNRDIYQVGGFYRSSDGTHGYLNDDHKLDRVTLDWQLIRPNDVRTPIGRSSHGLCVLGKKGDEHLVMMGGIGTKISFPTRGCQFIRDPKSPDLGFNNEVWLFSLRMSE